MKLLDVLHGSYVHPRRVRVLGRALADLIPENAIVLDVGCGDGSLAETVHEQRSDVRVHGIDVLARRQTRIPVTPFDGLRFPFFDNSFDIVTFVDVLHHASDPLRLLKEAKRVVRRAILVKDHLLEGTGAHVTLRLMDRIGNRRFGVGVPHNYWTPRQWQEAFDSLGLRIDAWKPHLGLYPKPATWLFDRSLHFVARLEPRVTE